MSAVRDAIDAAREFEQTKAAFERVRESLIGQLLATTIGESLLRDKLVLTIQALEAVQRDLLTVAAGAEIEAHVEASKAD